MTLGCQQAHAAQILADGVVCVALLLDQHKECGPKKCMRVPHFVTRHHQITKYQTTNRSE